MPKKKKEEVEEAVETVDEVEVVTPVDPEPIAVPIATSRNASLHLCNLVSRGVKMKTAKRRNA